MVYIITYFLTMCVNPTDVFLCIFVDSGFWKRRGQGNYFFLFSWGVCSASPLPRLAETTFSTARLISLLLSFPRLGGYLTVLSLAILISSLNHFKIISLGHFQISDITKRWVSLQRKKRISNKWLNLIPFQAPIADCVSSYMYLKIFSFLRKVLSCLQPFHNRFKILRHF